MRIKIHLYYIYIVYLYNIVYYLFTNVTISRVLFASIDIFIPVVGTSLLERHRKLFFRL